MEELPNELVHQIFGSLYLDDLEALSRVSRSLHPSAREKMERLRDAYEHDLRLVSEMCAAARYFHWYNDGFDPEIPALRGLGLSSARAIASFLGQRFAYHDKVVITRQGPSVPPSKREWYNNETYLRKRYHLEPLPLEDMLNVRVNEPFRRITVDSNPDVGDVMFATSALARYPFHEDIREMRLDSSTDGTLYLTVTLDY